MPEKAETPYLKLRRRQKARSKRWEPIDPRTSWQLYLQPGLRKAVEEEAKNSPHYIKATDLVRTLIWEALDARWLEREKNR